MDKVKKMSNKECLKELNRISQLKKPLGKQYIKQKEKIKPDYNIFEKPKKAKVEDYLSIETLTELQDWIHDKEARHTIHKWINKYNKDQSVSSSSSSSSSDTE
jgi:hypothetical protein